VNFEPFFHQHIKKLNVKSNGQATGLCPFHEDKQPSFSCNINDGLWICHGCGKSGNVVQFANALGLEPPCEANSTKTTEIARYDYTDENGKLLYQVRRFYPKNFRPYRLDSQGQWTQGIGNTRRVLYNLPKLISSEYACLTEGEKDAETLINMGFVATTHAFGAKSWRDEYSDSLINKKIVIIPDNDEAGIAWTSTVIKSLWSKAKAIKVVKPPSEKDITEWQESGGNAEALWLVIKNTPVVDENEHQRIYKTSHVEKNSHEQPIKLTSIKDLLSEPEEEFDYIVDDLLLIGGLSLMVAKPKTGKSTLARQLALSVARGESFLGRKVKAGLVIYVGLEDRRTDVRRHFRAMGATGNENLKIFVGMSPANAIDELRKVAENEKPALIIVDTLARLARIKDLNDYSHVTNGLEPILAIARDVGAHLLLTHHAKKGKSEGIDSTLGSTALVGSVDTVIFLNKGEKYRTISSTQRDGNDIQKTVLNFDTETKITSLGESHEQAEIDRLKGAILDYLGGQSEPVEEINIQEGVEGRRIYCQKAIRQLHNDGYVERTGRGKRGSPYLYSINHSNSGSLVPTICREGENQKENNCISTDKTSKATYSPDLTPNLSVSETHFESEAVQRVLDIFEGSRVLSDEEAALLGVKPNEMFKH